MLSKILIFTLGTWFGMLIAALLAAGKD